MKYIYLTVIHGRHGHWCIYVNDDYYMMWEKIALFDTKLK